MSKYQPALAIGSDFHEIQKLAIELNGRVERDRQTGLYRVFPKASRPTQWAESTNEDHIVAALGR